MFHGSQYYHDGISSPGDQHFNGTGKPWCDDRRAALSSEGADVGPRWRESDTWQRRIERARMDSERISRWFEHRGRLIENAMRDTERDYVIPQHEVVGVEVEDEFEKRREVFLGKIVSFNLLKGST